jgi:hypothetical protein
MALTSLRYLIPLALSLVGSQPASGIDSVQVGSGGRYFDRWDNLVYESRRLNIAPDSVWKWDVEAHQNIAPGLFRRGGRVAVIAGGQYSESTDDTPSTSYFGDTVITPFPAAGLVVDGDQATAYVPDGVEAARAAAIHIDLGESYGIERVRLYPRLAREFNDAFPQVFQVSTYGAEGAPLIMSRRDVQRYFTRIDALSYSTTVRNYAPVVDEVFHSRLVRYLRVDITESRAWELAEIEIYADGTVLGGQYTSNAIAAASSYPIWGHVLHEGHSIADLPVVVQTATGPNVNHSLYFRYTGFEGQLAPVTARQHARLRPEERGPIVRNPEWSEFEPLRGGVVASPSARKYLQFRVSLSEPGTVLRQLVFQYSRTPLVLRLAGEVNPNIVDAGETTTFTLSLQANTRTASESRDIDSRGFRRIRVRTTAAVHRVTAVTVRDHPVQYSVRHELGRGFDIFLGQRIEKDATFVQITFDGAIYRDGTRFEVQALDVMLSESGLDTLYQVAIPTNVEPRTPGGQLVVRLSESSQRVKLVASVAAVPPVLTPNGDGINDQSLITYDLVRVAEPVPARVAIYDLAGRLVRVLSDGEVIAGTWAHRWDGTQTSGGLVAPGLYVARVEVRAAHETAVVQIVLAVAY